MNNTNSPRSLRAFAVRTTLLAAVLAGAGLTACNTANTTQSGSARFGSNVHYERIVSNCWLNYKANVVGVREGTVSDNVKKVAVDVYSDQATTSASTTSSSGSMPAASRSQARLPP